MSWQDLVLSFGSVMFIFALIPMIISEHKPPLISSLISSAILYSFAFTYTTVDLVYAAVTTTVMATLWAIVAAQSWKQRRNKKEEKTEPRAIIDIENDIAAGSKKEASPLKSLID